MAILVYTESENGKLKKAAFEVASYAKGLADMMDTSVSAVTINADNVEELKRYGVEKVLKISNE